jgi:hypothetical protein
MKYFFITLLGVSSIQLATIKNIETRSIKVTNCIKPAMLKYWSYTPDTFSLKVNGTPLAPGTSCTIPLAQNSIKLRYDYSFAKGFRSGAKEMIVEVEPNKKELDISFSWNNEHRIIAPGIKINKDSIKRLKFNAQQKNIAI